MAVLEAHEAHQNLVDELLEEVAAYNPEVDRDLLTRAFRFAARAHEGQQRRSGEAFIHHPWGAAKICAQLRLDEQTIAAALLHDVVEDTETELDEVRAEFGDEIARLVDGVTKLTRVQFQSRAKHFYSIYDKMAKRGREFNEIYDLTAMRVVIERSAEEGTRDCYGALGLIHSLWKPMPGRFKDYIAMPKFNGYRSLHTTVIGPEGRPLEIQVRTREMHEIAELGVAAHWVYKRGKGRTKESEWVLWMQQLMDLQADETDPREFMKSFRMDVFDEEVYVFTPKGEVKTLPAGATPIDFAYA